MSKVKSYFETHSHAYHHESEFYSRIKVEIERFAHKRKIRLLDVGCGDGYFLHELIETGIQADYYGVDISSEMLKTSKDTLNNKEVNLVVADASSLPIRQDLRFDIIHLDSVLHHLIGKNRSASILLVRSMLRTLISRLTESGLLIIEEASYESYIWPSFTSRVIFYGCKLINFLNLDIGKLIPEFRLGLEVNFFGRSQIEDFLSAFKGNFYMFSNDPSNISVKYKLFLLKEISHIVYIFARQK